MYLYFVLFIIFFFSTHKQIYAAGHFTGSSKTMPNILAVFSFLNILLILAFVIHFSITVSFWIVLLFILCAIIAIFILDGALAKIVLKHLVKEGWDTTNELFIYTYNAECDIASTLIAEVGILVNIAIAVFYILSVL